MIAPLTFTVRVGYTDRSRTPDGRFTTFSTDVVILADTDIEAALLASQMVDAIRDDVHGMIVSTAVLGCIA